MRSDPRETFTPLTELAEKMGLDVPQDEEDLTLFYLFGLLPTGEWREYKTCDSEMAAILALGWRCLYAEIIRCRVDQKWDDLDLQSALKRTIAMLVSRTLRTEKNGNDGEDARKILPDPNW